MQNILSRLKELRQFHNAEVSDAPPAQRYHDIGKLFIYIAGSICFLISAYYVFSFIQNNWKAVAAYELGDSGAMWLVASAILYGTSLLVTAFAWPNILRNMGKSLPLRKTFCIGLIAQVGKYMPGNFAHFLGRAALAKRQSLNLTTSGVSTAVEIGSALMAATLVGLTGVIADPVVRRAIGTILPDSVSDMVFITITFSLFLLALVVLCSRRFFWLRQFLSVRLWAAPVLCLTASTLFAGLSFYALASAFGDASGISLVAATAIYAAAWIAGFVIPGAPAGIGVREAFLLLFLTPLLGPATAIVCPLAHRLLTAVVDITVAFFATGLYLYREHQAISPFSETSDHVI